jgi:hypothetical protein
LLCDLHLIYLLFLKLFYQLIPEATPKNLGVGALDLADSLRKGEKKFYI